jgi:hypothetical protein
MPYEFFTGDYIVWQNDDLSLEPWYQHAIDAAIVLSAPVIGSFITEAAEQMHRDTPGGFGGINRLHFLWLWLAAYY